MSIRIKLVIIIALISLTLGLAAWQVFNSAYQVEQKAKRFVPATGYLMGIAEVNNALTSQLKHTLDYLLTEKESARQQFDLLTEQVENGFQLCTSSVQELGVDNFSSGPELSVLKENYSLWLKNVEKVFELVDAGKKSAAMKEFQRNSSTLFEPLLLVPLDELLQNGFFNVERTYIALLIAFGGSYFSFDDNQPVIQTTHAAIHYLTGGSRVNVAIGKQATALANYLLTGDNNSLSRYHELKYDVRGRVDEWIFATNRRSSGFATRLGFSAHEVFSSLNKSFEMEEQAVDFKKAGQTDLALSSWLDSQKGGAIGHHLPMMVYSALQSGSRELVSSASKTGQVGVIVIGSLFIWVFLFVLFLNRRLLFALQQFQSGLLSLKEGDLHQKIDLQGKDELSELARTFNQMAESLHRSKHENEQLNLELEKRVENRTQELTRAYQELEAFNSAVSHDLHNPLSIIYGYCDLLRENEEIGSDVRREAMDSIYMTCERMDKIITGLLELSRIKTSHLEKSAVDITQLSHEVIERMKLLDAERQVVFQLAPGMLIQADKELMVIVMENLLGNAWKYTAGKDPSIIEVGSAEQNGQLVIFVRDNGAGFDMALSDRLFKPFRRLHDKKQFKGTGVGLATVQRIIQRHGGDIWAEGVVGVGATFYFTLPR